MPHNPTPPEGRNPPTSICPAVVVSRMSRSCVTRRELEASGSREDHQRAERDGEVDVRNDADQRAEAEVETAPHHGNGQDQDGEQDEERLLLAQFLVVPDIGADPSKPRRSVGDPGNRPRSGTVSGTRPSSPRSRAAELLHRDRVDRLGCRPVAPPRALSQGPGRRNRHERIITRPALTGQPTPRTGSSGARGTEREPDSSPSRLASGRLVRGCGYGSRR